MLHFSLRHNSLFAVSPAGRADTSSIIRMRAFNSLVLTGVLALGAVAARADNFVSNPNFCSTVSPCTSTDYGPVANWKGVGDTGSDSGFGAFTNTQSLSTLPGSPTSLGFTQAVYGPGPGGQAASLSQDVSTSLFAQMYTLSFYQAARSGTSNANVTVTAGLNSLESGVEVADSQGWVHESFNFFNADPDFTLTFTNNPTQYDSTALFTDVSLTLQGAPGGAAGPAATPEPSSLVFMVTGLIGAGGAARRGFLRA